jgi:hypothetical protein
MAITAYYYPREAARSYMLDLIDKELRKAMEDTPDYRDPYSSALYLRNSISLQTLRSAIEEAEMVRHTGTYPGTMAVSVYVGEKDIGGGGYFAWVYPDHTRWDVKPDPKYLRLIDQYFYLIWGDGEGFGMSLENSDAGEEARSCILGIIDEALLNATEDTPDYIEPNRSQLYFQNSISLQTLRDLVKDAHMYYRPSITPNPAGPVYVVGGQKIGHDNKIYCKYEDRRWGVTGPPYLDLIRNYMFQIGEIGEGFGMHPGLPQYYPLHYFIFKDTNMRQISPYSSDQPTFMDGTMTWNTFMTRGESITWHADLDGSENLILTTDHCPMNITVQRPDGSISLYFEYPDIVVLNPLAIPVDEGGTWNVTVTNSDMRGWGAACRLNLFARPAAVKLDLPKVTNDPYLISRLVAGMPGMIVVTENGETLSLSQPLTEGRHDLRFQRILADGRVSEVTRYFLTVAI